MSLTSKRRSVRRRERTQRRWSRMTYKLLAAAKLPVPNSKRLPWSSGSPRSCRRRCEHRNKKQIPGVTSFFHTFKHFFLSLTFFYIYLFFSIYYSFFFSFSLSFSRCTCAVATSSFSSSSPPC